MVWRWWMGTCRDGRADGFSIPRLVLRCGIRYSGGPSILCWTSLFGGEHNRGNPNWSPWIGRALRRMRREIKASDLYPWLRLQESMHAPLIRRPAPYSGVRLHANWRSPATPVSPETMKLMIGDAPVGTPTAKDWEHVEVSAP